MNISSRKTTHSWPVICRQSQHYESDDEYNDNDHNTTSKNSEEDDEDNDDEASDFESVFTNNQNYQKVSQNPTNSDYLSCRKYLVADYKPKQTSDFHTSTITSVVNAHSDFPLNLNTNRLTRNSIVPLMSQSQSQRRQTLSETNVSTTTVADEPTTCTAPSPIIFLLITLLMTISATGLLCLAVMTDHWEIIRWDRNLLQHLTNNTSHRLYWHLDDKVARLPISRKCYQSIENLQWKFVKISN